MRKITVSALFLLIAFITIRSGFDLTHETGKTAVEDTSTPEVQFHEITGNIKRGETLFDIFKHYGIRISELFKIKEASANIHKLNKLFPGHTYKIIIDNKDRLNAFQYWINDDTILNISRTESGFCAEKIPVDYESRILQITGTVNDNLVSSIGEGRGNLLLALQLSDIYAWDIDFAADLRNGDTYKIIVEGLYLENEFKKYGDILSAVFANNGKTFYAYRFDCNGKADYYDEDGNSLRKAFLKAPLSFRRISSSFSRRRYHPVLKIYRPHQGIDYSAPRGTPVSAVGDGKVIFAGRKGQYGRLIKIRHPNGYVTYYGHLSRIAKQIRRGSAVKQGELIGYVGATGLATGPHLHYEIRIRNKPVNPLGIRIPRGKPIPSALMSSFREYRDSMNSRFALINHQNPVFSRKKQGNVIN